MSIYGFPWDPGFQYHSTLAAMVAASAQGCEVCTFFLDTYKESSQHGGSRPIATSMGDSKLLSNTLSLDLKPRLSFITTQHRSLSPQQLVELDPAYKEVTKKAFERGSRGNVTELQGCIIGLRFHLGVDTRGVRYSLFADDGGNFLALRYCACADDLQMIP
jgi:hypothetical protein